MPKREIVGCWTVCRGEAAADSTAQIASREFSFGLLVFVAAQD